MKRQRLLLFRQNKFKTATTHEEIEEVVLGRDARQPVQTAEEAAPPPPPPPHRVAFRQPLTFDVLKE